MSEFIGSRISLVSRSDIRYVGTLHEINSETSTVALENVSSFGTEGRKNDPNEEIPPSDSVYEYIVFRGSDVKDLRIEEPPAAKENKPPQVPNDPAILGSGSRPPPQAQALRQGQQGPAPGTQQGPQQGGPPTGGPPQFGMPPPPFYHPAGWGRGGMPGPFPGMPPYGAPGGPPQGWFPPGGQGFPGQPGPFPPYGYPPPGMQFGHQGQQLKPGPIGPSGKQGPNIPTGPAADKQEPKSFAKPAEVAASPVLKAPTPPVATKPSAAEIKTAEIKIGVNQPTVSKAAANVAVKTAVPAVPVGPQVNRVQPVIPLANAAAVKAPLQTSAGNVPSVTQPAASLSDATKAATAAVAAAMAKLPPLGGQTNGNAMDNLTKKVNEMRTNDPMRAPRQPGATGFRGRGRGASRGGNAKIEVPTTDFDFESSNAKFSKQDLVKEAIAGSPQGTPESKSSSGNDNVPATSYNKATSFFDNISSEAKERESGNTRLGGREWRGEEQKKNVETFGQGSVDNGYRGGYRGRGRGRGGYRGRGNYGGNGQPGRGRGSYRGGRSDAQAVAQ